MEEGSFRSMDHALDNAYFIDDTGIDEAGDNRSFVEPILNDTDEVDVSRIPLPNAVPQKLDLNRLPHQVLRSATIDSLIQQNEDLMVRLKVQLRRNADLEEQVQSFKDNSSDIFHEIDRLKDELLIYKEKDRLFSNRNEATEQQLNQLRSKIQFLETQYAELYSAAREKQQKLAETQRQVSRYDKYRRAILRVAKDLRTQAASLTDLYTQEKATTRDLQIKLGEAAERIQFLNRQHKEDQAHMVQSYESQISAVTAELKQAQTEVSDLQKVAEHVEHLKDEKIEWENEKVRLQRQIQNDRESAGKQIRELQEALSGYRQDAKDKGIKIHSLEEDLLDQRTKLDETLKERNALLEQVESLQCLWRDNQNQIDKKDSQIDSLQKLNQQLSQQINGLRKENSDLKSRKESDSFKAEERIKELNSQVKVLGTKKVQTENQKVALKRIESLLAEIQSGFKLKPKQEATQDKSSSTSNAGA